MLALSIGAFINARLYYRRLIKRSPFSSAPFRRRPYYSKPRRALLCSRQRHIFWTRIESVQVDRSYQSATDMDNGRHTGITIWYNTLTFKIQNRYDLIFVQG